jgi:hypothetical protein
MRTALIVLLSALTLAAETAPATNTLAVPNHVNSTPWVAAKGRFVAVAWGAAANGKGDIVLAVSRDGGQTFSTPVRVNSVEGDARISGEIAPRVALLARSGAADPLITVTWNAKDGTTQIRTARSRDGGRTFVEEMNLQTKGAIGDRGWQASTLDSRGSLHTIWLDHRAMAAAKAAGDHSAHKGEHDGVAMAQRSGLYYAADGVPERELFKGVCYCCKTAIATGPKGQIYAAWRHVFAGNMRDMGFTASRDGGKTFSPLVRVSQDGWSINGCPDDGPAMAVDAAGTVHLVWPTVKNEAGVILYATSRNDAAFSIPARVPTLGGPKPSHPQVVVDGRGRVFIAWDEVTAGVRRAAVVPITTSASAAPKFGTPALIAETAPSSYPVLAAVDGGLIAAWTSGPLNRPGLSGVEGSTIGVRVIQ